MRIDGLEVPDELVVAQAHEVRWQDQGPVRTRFLRGMDLFDDLPFADRAGPDDDWTAPSAGGYRNPREPRALGERQRPELAGAAGHHHPRGTGLEEAVDIRGERFLVDREVAAKRRRERRHRA